MCRAKYKQGFVNENCNNKFTIALINKVQLYSIYSRVLISNDNYCLRFFSSKTHR